jgi:sugar/nucleoside kinase (ribokinase family)
VPVVPREKIVDLIGSGDAFVGGFLSEFVRLRQGRPTGESVADDDVSRCVASGHFASSEVIQHAGCTFSTATG